MIYISLASHIMLDRFLASRTARVGTLDAARYATQLGRSAYMPERMPQQYIYMATMMR